MLPSARLQPRKPPGELFRAFNPDPVADDAGEVARKAFAIVQQLDTEQPLKPPTLVTVFTRYCMDGLSAGQIARKHNCSKPTVLRRLEKIRQRTGVAPQQLRSFSPHLQDVEKTLCRQLGMRVQLRASRERGKGRLVIHYGSLDQFDEIIDRLGVNLAND